MTYGLKEYKALLEKNMSDLKDPMSVPFGMDPFSQQATAYRTAKMESINYALEMLPEIKEPMKDHIFREEVNSLKCLVLKHAQSDSLRVRLSMFLSDFKNKVQS